MGAQIKNQGPLKKKIKATTPFIPTDCMINKTYKRKTESSATFYFTAYIYHVFWPRHACI